MDTGKHICILLFTSTFVSNTADIKKFGNALVMRLLDRGFKPDLKKDLEDDLDDDVNTR